MPLLSLQRLGIFSRVALCLGGSVSCCYSSELGTRQIFSFTNHNDNAKNSKNVNFLVSKLSSHIEYSNNAITNNFVA